MESPASSSSVKNLIDRIRSEGVEEGKREADSLLENARSRAVHILEEAEKKAEQVTKEARQEAERVESSAKAALQLAVRDASLKLREEILSRLGNELRQLVTRKLHDEGILKDLLAEIARKATPDQHEGTVRVLMPNDVLTVEQLRKDPQELDEGSLSQFAVGLARDVMSKGIEIAPGPDDRGGIRIELANEDVQIDCTDTAVTELLMQHLMPRFRAMMEGMVA